MSAISRSFEPRVGSSSAPLLDARAEQFRSASETAGEGSDVGEEGFMEAPIGTDEEIACEPVFAEFIRLFAMIRDHEKLFPKPCRSCGEEYYNFAEYLCMTMPKGHVLEDCSKVMKRPFTMIYRHCSCGNTLVLSLTAETFPELDRFWRTLRQVAEESGRPLVDVVGEFSQQCDSFILHTENPCL